MEDNKDCKSLTVYKKDIHNIGHTAFGEDATKDEQVGGTTFVCDIKLANIEEILLREILSLYGYKITETRDRFHDDEWKRVDIDFVTNMPFKEFMGLKRN